jgi:hypothetical protein
MLVLTHHRLATVSLDFSGMTDDQLLSLRSTGTITLKVVDIRGDRVRLGYDAPNAVKVHRNAVLDAKH